MARYSFSRFLGLHAADKIPDATTIWRFREDLIKAGVINRLFERLDDFLRDQGYRAQKRQIIDGKYCQGSDTAKQPQGKSADQAGNQPEGWGQNGKRQKNTDARWTRKDNKNFFGYKNHISVDVKHKPESVRPNALPPQN